MRILFVHTICVCMCVCVPYCVRKVPDTFAIDRWRQKDSDLFYTDTFMLVYCGSRVLFSNSTQIVILLTTIQSVCPRIYVIQLARHQRSRRALDRGRARAAYRRAATGHLRTLNVNDNVRHHHRFRIGRPREREVRREDAKARATLDRGSRRRRIRARGRAGQGTSRCEMSIARLMGEWLRK